MLDLVEFECGCVGTAPANGESHIFEVCGRDGGGLTLFQRNMSGKTYETLTEEQRTVLVERIGAAIYRAGEFTTLRDLLRRMLKI